MYLEYGTMVIADGALRQLVELIGYGYLSLLFYVLFKACERVLVERLTSDKRPDGGVAAGAQASGSKGNKIVANVGDTD